MKVIPKRQQHTTTRGLLATDSTGLDRSELCPVWKAAQGPPGAPRPAPSWFSQHQLPAREEFLEGTPKETEAGLSPLGSPLCSRCYMWSPRWWSSC